MPEDTFIPSTTEELDLMISDVLDRISHIEFDWDLELFHTVKQLRENGHTISIEMDKQLSTLWERLTA